MDARVARVITRNTLNGLAVTLKERANRDFVFLPRTQDNFAFDFNKGDCDDRDEDDNFLSVVWAGHFSFWLIVTRIHYQSERGLSRVTWI